jgi:hypothetical protein
LERAVAGQLQPLVRRRGSTALAEAIKSEDRTTDRDAELADGEATGWWDVVQEHCGPEAGALGRFMVMSTAIR